MQPKFRGFSKELNKWVYGFGWFETGYTKEYLERLGQDAQDAVLYTENAPIVCHLASMSQYIGETDANGNDIYNGDILQPRNGEYSYYTVIWKDVGFKKRCRYVQTYEGVKWEEESITPIHAKQFIVIGNTFEQENPINE